MDNSACIHLALGSLGRVSSMTDLGTGSGSGGAFAADGAGDVGKPVGEATIARTLAGLVARLRCSLGWPSQPPGKSRGFASCGGAESLP